MTKLMHNRKSDDACDLWGDPETVVTFMSKLWRDETNAAFTKGFRVAQIHCNEATINALSLSLSFLHDLPNPDIFKVTLTKFMDADLVQDNTLKEPRILYDKRE